MPLKSPQPLAELPEQEIQNPLQLPSKPPLHIPPQDIKPDKEPLQKEEPFPQRPRQDIKPDKEPPWMDESFPQRPPPGIQPGPQRGSQRPPPTRSGKRR